MMWELISANRRRSLGLFVGMAALLCGLGYTIGAVVHPNGGGIIGLIFAGGLWMVLASMSIFGGGSLVLRFSHAKEVSPDIHPRLHNIVEEMKIAAGLEKMPKVYIIDERAPNAFATGLSPDDSAVVVTAGLLSRLSRDELQGVIGHEVSHIMNRDMQFMTLASIMLGTIVILSEVFLRGMWLSGGGSSRRYRSGQGGGGTQPAMIVLAIVLAILGPVFARLLYLAISRRREYLADACSARLTRYPAGLADALEKISSENIPLHAASQATAPMFISSPLREKKGGGISSWGNTHPPIGKRIAILRAMTQGAGLGAYERAFADTEGEKGLIPSASLKKAETVALREPTADDAPTSPADQERSVLDLMRAVNGFAFLVCTCGMRIKVPPDFEGDSVECPRCHRKNEVPRAKESDVSDAATVMAAAMGVTQAGGVAGTRSAAGATTGRRDQVLEYKRRGTGWESFSCACGNLLQLSPAFRGSQLQCHKCNRITRII